MVLRDDDKDMVVISVGKTLVGSGKMTTVSVGRTVNDVSEREGDGVKTLRETLISEVGMGISRDVPATGVDRSIVVEVSGKISSLVGIRGVVTLDNVIVGVKDLGVPIDVEIVSIDVGSEVGNNREIVVETSSTEVGNTFEVGDISTEVGITSIEVVNTSAEVENIISIDVGTTAGEVDGVGDGVKTLIERDSS